MKKTGFVVCLLFVSLIFFGCEKDVPEIRYIEKPTPTPTPIPEPKPTPEPEPTPEPYNPLDDCLTLAFTNNTKYTLRVTLEPLFAYVLHESSYFGSSGAVFDNKGLKWTYVFYCPNVRFPAQVRYYFIQSTSWFFYPSEWEGTVDFNYLGQRKTINLVE
jgi:hypothetical protein